MSPNPNDVNMGLVSGPITLGWSITPGAGETMKCSKDATGWCAHFPERVKNCRISLNKPSGSGVLNASDVKCKVGLTGLKPNFK